ncbi:MAG: AMP-binding protein [Candidatus Melainabacteria bacterium]|nr:AMP-binding protein [Candidatus Melainabacteria bacterium]
MNLVKILDGLAYLQPKHVALRDCHAGSDRTITYLELQKRAECAAAALIESGIKKDDRVLLLVPLSIETYILLLAIFRVGAVAIIADSSFGLNMLKRSLSLVQPDAMISNPHLKFLGSILSEIRNIRLKLDTQQLASGAPQAQHEIEDLDSEHPALITFTSGSTGNPKAIVRTHEFLLQQQKVLSSTLPGQKCDVELTTLPVFVLSALAQGMTSVLPDCDMRRPGSIDARRIVNQLANCNVNRIIASPAFLQRLTEFLQQEKLQLKALQNILTGGGPVFPSLLKQAKSVFPNAEIIAVYGSTEAEPIAHITNKSMSQDDLEKIFTGGGLLAGKPIANIELAIADPKELNSLAKNGGNRKFNRLPAYSTGEIVVRGKHVIKTYLNELGDTETKFKEVDSKVWHRTGDAGYLDEHGRLWLMGRCALKIRDEKGDIYPFQVEAAASEIQAVRRATCLRADGKRILVVEKKHRTPAQWFADLFDFSRHSAPLSSTIGDAFTWLRFDEIRMVHSMPLDARHNSKIQYERLERRLKHAWSP